MPSPAPIAASIVGNPEPNKISRESPLNLHLRERGGALPFKTASMLSSATIPMLVLLSIVADPICGNNSIERTCLSGRRLVEVRRDIRATPSRAALTSNLGVKELATIAHENGISITFHINEAPMMEQGHFKHLHENDTYIRPEDFPVVDDLLDWLIDKQRQGWKMVDSIPRLQNMKGFMRGVGEHWGCRAGQNWLIIRTNGTLAPCFPPHYASYDWGSIGNQKRDRRQLSEMKRGCEPHCFSTLGYNVAYCYNTARVMKWLWKQAMNGFQGATGSFE